MSEQKKSKLVQIEAVVMPQTFRSLQHNQRDTGLSIGEVIDRLAVQIHAKDAAMAVQIILEEIQIILRDLPTDQQITALWEVITTVAALMPEEYLPRIEVEAHKKQTSLLENITRENDNE